MGKMYSSNNVNLSTLVRYIDIDKYKIVLEDGEDDNRYQYEVVDKYVDGCIQLMRISWEERYAAADIANGDYRKVKKMKVHKDFIVVTLEELDMTHAKHNFHRFSLVVILDRQEATNKEMIDADVE